MNTAAALSHFNPHTTMDTTDNSQVSISFSNLNFNTPPSTSKMRERRISKLEESPRVELCEGSSPSNDSDCENSGDFQNSMQ
jgi:hypothetical protein